MSEQRILPFDVDVEGESYPEIPPGWLTVKLGEVADVVRGASPRPKGDPRYFGGPIPWISIRDITAQQGRILASTREGVTKAGAEKSRHLPAGTLILSNSGTVCVPKILGVPGCIHDGFVAFPKLTAHIDPIFLFEYFNWIRPEVTAIHRQGITQVNLNTGIVRDLDIPLAPSPEQRRIVDALDSYLTCLDAAAEGLKRVEKNLERYRASVLKAAVEGRLVPTEAELAKAEGRDYEPASVLLERILEERRRRWEEAELARMKEKGKVPKDDKWKSRYKEPAGPDTNELPELPEGWCWSTVEQLAWASGYGTSVRCTPNAAGIPVIRIPNVADSKLNVKNLKYATKELYLPAGSELTNGDFLVIRTNGSRSLIGRAVYIEFRLPSTYFFASYLIRFRLASSQIAPVVGRWLASFWQAPDSRIKLEAKAATSAGQYNLSMSSLGVLAFPLPPEAEQIRICEVIDSLFSSLDTTKTTLAMNSVRIERLRQSILKWAFEGKLVDQDPDDEPASKLLERIRQEREAAPPARKKRAPRRKKT